MIGTSCSDVLAINLFTSHQARQEVWTILKDMEKMRQSLEIMRSRTQEAEKHATVLAFLTEDLRRKHEEDKAKNNKLIQLVYLKEEEIRYFGNMYGSGPYRPLNVVGVTNGTSSVKKKTTTEMNCR